MDAISEDILPLKAHLTTLLPTTPVKVAYLYGSTARGQGTPLSDVDLAIVTGDRLDTLERFHLEMSLEATLERLGFPHVDIREVTYAPPVARGRIVSEGILLYCRDDRVRVAFEVSARCEYFDLKPFLEQYCRTFLQSTEVTVREDKENDRILQSRLDDFVRYEEYILGYLKRSQ